MARSELTLTTGVKNGSVVLTQNDTAGGATGTSGYYCDVSGNADQRISLTFRETADGDTGAIWVKAGAYDANGQGDLEVLVGGLEAQTIGHLEGARFKTADGHLQVDVGGVTGVISIVAQP